MYYDKALDLSILSRVYDECNAPNSIATLFSSNFKRFKEFKDVSLIMLIKHVMHLTEEDYLVCNILDDTGPVVKEPRLYDFNIKGLTPKGFNFLAEYREDLKS